MSRGAVDTLTDTSPLDPRGAGADGTDAAPAVIANVEIVAPADGTEAASRPSTTEA